MSRPHLPIKAKRNNYTLSLKAQQIIDRQTNKSKFVSDAIIAKFEREATTNDSPTEDSGT
jgi:hypothetical protein